MVAARDLGRAQNSARRNCARPAGEIRADRAATRRTVRDFNGGRQWHGQDNLHRKTGASSWATWIQRPSGGGRYVSRRGERTTCAVGQKARHGNGPGPAQRRPCSALLRGVSEGGQAQDAIPFG